LKLRWLSREDQDRELGRLINIWRYFRHLIRNAVRPGRPVIGIALLASPVNELA
jgi:hypothetical protein